MQVAQAAPSNLVLLSRRPSAAVPARRSRTGARGTYLVVALGVEAVVVLAVLVGAVDVATVLAA